MPKPWHVESSGFCLINEIVVRLVFRWVTILNMVLLKFILLDGTYLSFLKTIKFKFLNISILLRKYCNRIGKN